MDKDFEEYVINYKVPFPIILTKAGYEGYSYSGKVFCPFHDNYNSPAAKIFKDEDGDKLYCFSEHKLYRPVDVIKNKLISISISTLYENIWKQLSDASKERIKEQYGKPIDYMPKNWSVNQDSLLEFKRGIITYDKFLDILIGSVKQ